MNGYSRLQIILHWLIAALIIATWITHEAMGDAVKAAANGTLQSTPPHVPLGIAVFVLVLIRVIVRMRQGSPAPAPQPDATMEAAALWGHRALYLLMIVVPMLGMARWGGGIEVAGEVHEVAANTLMLLALGHAAVAIWHQYVRKDGTLTRMLRPGS